MHWWSWLFGAVFWTWVAWRVRRARAGQSSDVAAPVDESGPRWSPFRTRGF